MTDLQRAAKIEKALAMYLDPESSPEQKDAAGAAIQRLQAGLTPEFWRTREPAPKVRTRVQREKPEPGSTFTPIVGPLGLTLGDLLNAGVDAATKRILKTLKVKFQL